MLNNLMNGVKKNMLRAQINVVITKLERNIEELRTKNDRASKELIKVYQEDIQAYKDYLETL